MADFSSHVPLKNKRSPFPSNQFPMDGYSVYERAAACGPGSTGPRGEGPEEMDPDRGAEGDCVGRGDHGPGHDEWDWYIIYRNHPSIMGVYIYYLLYNIIHGVFGIEVYGTSH